MVIGIIQLFLDINCSSYYFARPKDDEILSWIRSLFKHPGKIRENERVMEVILDPINSRPMRGSVESVLENINKNNGIRLPDGRLFRIKMTH